MNPPLHVWVVFIALISLIVAVEFGITYLLMLATS